ncbi:putative phosphonate metabolism protein [Rhizobium sp. RU20A]|uniref:DUF1045 domain-containing protein n=1 Tax=Rhizobium sp. RU20A TaxID=1907412 RepID=UPI0009566740|nr:DUF1045 domain-containing protein [Rhizobium sp. RU20A]SIR28882.1 putative phosphonate metabolism protein [Rhizobium sp. RU20A]
MRFALYFTPPAADPLTRTAARWLGRDAFSGEILAPAGPLPDGYDAAEHAALVADPVRYGFHGTLKAPFSLADSCTAAELVTALKDFASVTPAFTIPRLTVGRLGPFFALVPDGPAPELEAFAAACVRDFEPFRAPLSAADIIRRKPETLTESERAHLHAWGYPYVFSDFRFHMTLTGPVEETARDAMHAHLDSLFAPLLDRPVPVDHITLFAETERGAPFRVHANEALALEGKTT